MADVVVREVEGRERTKGDEAAAGGFFSSEREPSAAGPFVSSRVGVGVVPQAVRGEGYSAQRGEPRERREVPPPEVVIARVEVREVRREGEDRETDPGEEDDARSRSRSLLLLLPLNLLRGVVVFVRDAREGTPRDVRAVALRRRRRAAPRQDRLERQDRRGRGYRRSGRRRARGTRRFAARSPRRRPLVVARAVDASRVALVEDVRGVHAREGRARLRGGGGGGGGGGILPRGAAGGASSSLGRADEPNRGPRAAGGTRARGDASGGAAAAPRARARVGSARRARRRARGRRAFAHERTHDVVDRPLVRLRVVVVRPRGSVEARAVEAVRGPRPRRRAGRGRRPGRSHRPDAGPTRGCIGADRPAGPRCARKWGCPEKAVSRIWARVDVSVSTAS